MRARRFERLEALSGVRVAEGYGLTETSPMTHCNPVEGKRKVGHIGVPCPTPCGCAACSPTTRRGEVEPARWRAGRQVPAGHARLLAAPDETAAVLRDGWFSRATSRSRQDGFFRIVGRRMR
jgi:long-chain acyl-CoA synthetase